MTAVNIVDLFCGGGGTSTGAIRAAGRAGLKVELCAVNHWEIAIETHSRNHPTAKHLCKAIDQVRPREAVRGQVDLLLASPECTHHSVARGGMPINDQSRMSAWEVIRWAAELLPRRIIVENVKEFQTWGPIGSNQRPLKSRRGETFAAWCQALRSLGYRLDMRVLNAANYGGATTRERLFVQAVRGRAEILWPAQTHARDGGEQAQQRGAGDAHPVTEPAPTITTRDRFGLAQFQGVAYLDIHFRMLQPHELAAAMGFPRDYYFHGNREQRVKQIGNAVHVDQAEALVAAALGVSA